MFKQLTEFCNYIYYQYLEWEARAYIPGQTYRDAELREMIRKDRFGEIY